MSQYEPLEVTKDLISGFLEDAIMFWNAGYTTTAICCIQDALLGIRKMHNLAIKETS